MIRSPAASVSDPLRPAAFANVPALALALALLAGAFAATPAAARDPAADTPIPDEWLTVAERTDFQATSSYAETIELLEKIAARLPEVELTTFGTSAAGRPLPLVILSPDKRFEPGGSRPVVMIQNGIHAGEIDGKDACLMLLRDAALGRRPELLGGPTLLIVPIYNVDGHERVSPCNRPNQNGPTEGMGWRTTDSGLDLNRDHLKLVSPEARALAGLIDRWRPHLHVDDHVTDGVDHDWVLTWAWAEPPQVPAPVGAWLAEHMPRVVAATAAAGHRNGPYVDLLDRADPARGLSSLVVEPRYATGYWPLRNRPSVLVENHSYKPYRERVLANRDFLAALLAEVARDPGGLRGAVAAAEAAEVARGRAGAEPSEAVVRWAPAPRPDTIRFPVYAFSTVPSAVTGAPMVVYRQGEVREIEVPWEHLLVPELTVPRPRGYLVLPGWPAIAERLEGHGLVVRRLARPAAVDVETIRVADPEYAETPYQGLTRVTATAERRAETVEVPAGALWVPADQPDFEVAVQLLEPEAPDSLFAWGLLSTVLELKEYVETRVLEEWVAGRLADDPELAAEWQQALGDPALAADSRARWLWWYRRTPWFDPRFGLLPVYRVGEPGLAAVTAALDSGS
jgi:hypothetical protein